MTNNNEVIEWTPGMMLEVTLNTPDDFLKVKETLTRMGVSSQRENNTLFQSCHILHKQGRYFIVHFKELFLLDGKLSNLSTEDVSRRNTIAVLLSDWGLVNIVDRSIIGTNLAPMKSIKVIPFKEKASWKLESKYSIGKVKGK